MSIGVPIKVLHESQGHIVTVGKNGLSLFTLTNQKFPIRFLVIEIFCSQKRE